MSPSGFVITRLVHPVAGPVVMGQMVLAAKSRSDALVVTSGGVLLLAVLPLAAAVTSTGFTESTPLYSRTRTSAIIAAGVNDTLTMLAPAAAAAMFFA